MLVNVDILITQIGPRNFSSMQQQPAWERDLALRGHLRSDVEDNHIFCGFIEFQCLGG